MTHAPRRMLAITLLLAPLGGCNLYQNTMDMFGNSIGNETTVQRLQSAPPIKGETLDRRHLLVMQAPNPGWSFSIDRTDRERDGWVVSLTIREPNPAFMYPQRIVEKQLLTEVEADQPLRVMARVLTHDEKDDVSGYAPFGLVESFEP